jgi:ABC-type branched-subunit amino acid transport system substrate-binding protein
MMRFLTRRWRHAVFSLMFLPWSALAASNFIVIGQAIDLSGPNASIGRDYVAGIKTCFDALNAAGGIGGRRIQYIVRDDRGAPQAAVKAVAELIERDQVDYLFGGIGDDVVRAVADDPLFRRSGLTLFAPLASAGAPAAAGPVLFWRPGYQQEIRHIFAHFAKLGVKDIGVVYQPSPSNRDAYDSLSAEIRERKMTLTATMQIGADTGKLTPQFAADASRMAASKPGFVVVIADTIGTGLFLKEFRKHSAQTFVAGTSLINLDTLRELAGARAVEWTVFSQVVPNPNAGTSLLQTEHLNMMRKYRDENVSSLTLEGFAAAKSLARAIQLARQPGRAALQDWLAQKREIDLGGLSIAAPWGTGHLSNYLDIALFRKGGGLVF